MSIKGALAFVAVKDLKSGKAWYEKLLGRAPDTNPMNELYEWQFAGGWLQLVEDKKRAGSSSVTFVETDFEKRLTDLKAAGMQTLEPMRGECWTWSFWQTPMAIRLCLLMERLRAIER